MSTVNGWVWGLGCWFVVVTGFGCSSEAAGPSSGANAGSTATGASSTGAGASGAAAGTNGAGSNSAGGQTSSVPELPRPDPAKASKYEACAYYMNQIARQRFQVCGGASEASMRATFDQGLSRCPDMLFAPGSQVTTAQAIQCGDAWAKFPCAAALRDEYPECGLPHGSRELNQRCTSCHQCASGSCGVSGDRCGFCRPLLAPGAACGGNVGYCPLGYTCSAASLCERNPAPCTKAGEVCAKGAVSMPGLYCDLSAPAAGVCRLYDGNSQSRALGAACDSNSSCLSGACNSGRCEAAAALGTACETWTHQCVPDAYCNRWLAVSVCEKRIERGASCERWDSAFCAEGLVCTGATLTATTDMHCVQERRLGESCGEPGMSCLTGLKCDGKLCVEASELGEYSQSCPFG